jgi:hypothetical protein
MEQEDSSRASGMLKIEHLVVQSCGNMHTNILGENYLNCVYYSEVYICKCWLSSSSSGSGGGSSSSSRLFFVIHDLYASPNITQSMKIRNGTALL